jgi:hypothetical protein
LMEFHAEEILQIADTPRIGVKTKTTEDGIEVTEGDMIEHRRLQVEARKWLLSKLVPKKYGDLQKVEHSGELTLNGLAERMRKKAAG